MTTENEMNWPELTELLTSLPNSRVNTQEIADMSDLDVQTVFEDKNTECPICFETLTTSKNISITSCGHSFCFKCISKHASSHNTCPCCRTPLYDEPHKSDSQTTEDDDEYEEYTGDEEEFEEDDEDDNEDEDADGSPYYCTVERVLDNVHGKFSMKDVLSILLGRYSKTDEKYTPDHCKKIEDEFWDIVNKLDFDHYNEGEERDAMTAEDVRV
jgi:Ring finger domain